VLAKQTQRAAACCEASGVDEKEFAPSLAILVGDGERELHRVVRDQAVCFSIRKSVGLKYRVDGRRVI
jgi:hypothetical protein